MNNPTDNTLELKSPFEQLREVDAEGREWWNSRKLARVMGYGKYWNVERVLANTYKLEGMPRSAPDFDKLMYFSEEESYFTLEKPRKRVKMAFQYTMFHFF